MTGACGTGVRRKTPPFGWENRHVLSIFHFPKLREHEFLSILGFPQVAKHYPD